MDLLFKGYRPYLLLAIVCLVLYSQMAFFGLSYLDDNILIAESREFNKLPSDIADAFLKDVFHSLGEYDAAYRPILTVSFIIDAHADRLFAIGYRFSNIAFHLVASCLVFLLFLKLKYGRPIALFFSLVFAVHPAFVSVVAWIPGRNDSLMGIFALSSFIFLMEFLARGRRRDLVLHTTFFLLALFTKETALAVLAVSIFYSVYVAGERYLSEKNKELLALWLTVLAVWSAFRGYALSDIPLTMPAVNVIRDILSGIPAILIYAGKVLLPFNLSIIPTIEDTTIVYGVVSVLIITLGLMASKGRRAVYILLGALWFLSFIIPTFIRPLSSAQAVFLESRLYLPMVGIFMVMGEIDIIKSFSNNRKAIVCACAAIGLFFCLNLRYAAHFKDAATFWEHAVKGSPHSSLAMYNLSWIYGAQGRAKEAEAGYKRALELNPRQRYAHNELGVIYERRGRLKEAASEYAREIGNAPYNATAYSNLDRAIRALNQKNGD